MKDQELISIAIPHTENGRVEAENLNGDGTGFDTIQKTVGRKLGIRIVKEALIAKGRIARAIISDDASWRAKEPGRNVVEVVTGQTYLFDWSGGVPGDVS